MDDSQNDIHPDVKSLADKVVADFAADQRQHDNYRDQRLDLIDRVGNGGLSGVDEQLAEELASREVSDPVLRQRIVGWSKVLVAHTKAGSVQ